MKIEINFNWKLTLLVVFSLPILCSLGFWQLQRAEEKRDIQKNYNELVNAQPIEYDALNNNTKTNFRNVVIKGTVVKKVFLVDNQIYNGKVGYEVIQPVTMESGEVIFVSRGWKLGDMDRTKLPQIDTPNGDVTMKGYLYQPTNAFVLGNEETPTSSPIVMQSISLERMYKMLGINDKMPSRFLIRLDKDSEFLFTPHWVIVNQGPEKHIAYAYQWFGMAALLFGLFCYSSVRYSRD